MVFKRQSVLVLPISLKKPKSPLSRRQNRTQAVNHAPLRELQKEAG